jgi:hypothetical protein
MRRNQCLGQWNQKLQDIYWDVAGTHLANRYLCYRQSASSFPCSWGLTEAFLSKLKAVRTLTASLCFYHLTFNLQGCRKVNLAKKKQKQTPWPGSASELYQPSDRRLSEKIVPRGQRDGSPRPYSRLSRQEPVLFLSSSSPVVLTRLKGPRPELLATGPEVRVRFPALPDFLRSSGSGTGSIQPREYTRGATWKKK